MANPYDPQTQAQLQSMASQQPQPSPVASYQPPPVSAPNMSYAAPPGSVAMNGAPGATEAQGQAPVDLSKLVGPTRQMPAQWVPTSRATQMQSGVEYSPETYQALDAMTQALNQGDVDQAKALAAQQAEDQKRAQAQATMADNDYAEFVQRKRAQAGAQQEAMGRINGAMMDVEDAQAKGIDRGRWMHNQSTLDKIGLGIGAIANGWLVGTGKESSNATLDHMYHAIDQDVQDQKDAAAGKEKSLQNAMSYYSLLRQKGMDEDQAADGAKLLAHQQLDAHLKAALPDAQNALGRVALDKSIADNQQKILQLRSAIEEKASDRTSVSGSESFRQAQTVGGAASILADAQKIYLSKYGQPGNTWDSAVRAAVRGKTGVDLAPGQAEAVIGAPKGGAGMGRSLARSVASAKASDKDLARLEELAGKTYLSQDEQAEANTLIANLEGAGVHGLPKGSTMLSRLIGTTQAQVHSARSTQKHKVEAAQETAAEFGGQGGAVGGDDEKGDETPEGFQGD